MVGFLVYGVGFPLLWIYKVRPGWLSLLHRLLPLTTIQVHVYHKTRRRGEQEGMAAASRQPSFLTARSEEPLLSGEERALERARAASLPMEVGADPSPRRAAVSFDGGEAVGMIKVTACCAKPGFAPLAGAR